MSEISSKPLAMLFKGFLLLLRVLVYNEHISSFSHNNVSLLYKVLLLCATKTAWLKTWTVWWKWVCKINKLHLYNNKLIFTLYGYPFLNVVATDVCFWYLSFTQHWIVYIKGKVIKRHLIECLMIYCRTRSCVVVSLFLRNTAQLWFMVKLRIELVSLRPQSWKSVPFHADTNLRCPGKKKNAPKFKLQFFFPHNLWLSFLKS